MPGHIACNKLKGEVAPFTSPPPPAGDEIIGTPLVLYISSIDKYFLNENER